MSLTQKIQKFCFFGISYSSLFMVLTIASVPIIARTHTNISFVTLFSLLTPTPFPPSFPCHHTGACQSSSYGLSTSNTHGRAIPRNHGFLEVAFAYMVGESLLQIEIFQVGRSTFGETPLSLTAHWKHLWPGGKTLMMKKWWSLAPKVEAARQQRTTGGVLGGGGDERQLDANCVHKDVHCVPDKSFYLQHLKKMHVWCSRDNVIDVFFGVLTGEECQLTCQFHGWAGRLHDAEAKTLFVAHQVQEGITLAVYVSTFGQNFSPLWD